MEVSFSPTFVRMLKCLSPDLQDEAIEKIEELKRPQNHTRLKVHKLKGQLNGRFSFSVNYRTRIVFVYLNTKPRTAHLLAIGDHHVYDV